MADDWTGAWVVGVEIWPNVAVPEDAFAHYIGERRDAGADPSRAGDLYLACACLRGDTAAIAALDRMIDDVTPALLELDPAREVVDDAKQALREKLLVGEAPRIADYSGRGDLHSWLRVAAIRTAISLQRKTRREVLDEELIAELPGADEDLELGYLKEKYSGEFKHAFEDALGELSARERNLLRHQVLDRLSIDQIGALYGVHRATAARWVVGARDALAAATKRALMKRLRIDRGEVESIMRLMDSRVRVSVERLLGEK